jgi:hypothetical protein
VRQAILVLMLVAAAFLGGAFVNGPGLQWLQSKVLRSIGLNNGGEIASVDLKPTLAADTRSNASPSAQPEVGVIQGPLAPIPSLLTEDESSKQNAPDHPLAPRLGPKPAARALESLVSQLTDSSKMSAKNTLPQQRSSGSDHALSDPNVAPAKALPSLTPPGTAPEPASRVPPALLDSLAALLPSNRSSPDAELLPSTPPVSSLPPTPRSVTNRSGDWAVLERKMQSLGVSHFTIEGEPGGHVVFSCLIPLAGREAVQAALQRIVLWRATQPPSQ